MLIRLVYLSGRPLERVSAICTYSFARQLGQTATKRAQEGLCLQACQVLPVAKVALVSLALLNCST